MDALLQPLPGGPGGPTLLAHTYLEEPGRPWPREPSRPTLLHEGPAHALASGWQLPLPEPYHLPRMNLTPDGDPALPVNAGPGTGGAWGEGNCGQSGLCSDAHRPAPKVTDLCPLSMCSTLCPGCKKTSEFQCSSPREAPEGELRLGAGVGGESGREIRPRLPGRESVSTWWTTLSVA